MTAKRTKTEETQSESLPMAPSSGAVALPMEQIQAAAGAGMEEMSADDFAVPYLSIAQKMSAVLDREKPEYIPEMQDGDIYNSVTGERFPGAEGVLVIPCHYRPSWREGEPSKSKPAFIAEHDHGWQGARGLERHAEGFDVNRAGKRVDRLMRFFVLKIDEKTGRTEPMLLTFKSTGLREAKKWDALLAARRMTATDGSEFQPPIFSGVWRVKTARMENDDGSWHVARVTPEGDVTDAVMFGDAKRFHEAVKGNEVTGDGEDPGA